MRIVFFGTPDFAVFGLEALLSLDGVEVALVVTQPDKPAGRGGRIQESPVKKLAASRAIPVLQPKSIRKELDAFLTEAGRHGPFDVGVVIAFGQILPREVLRMPRAGCVNVHASLLPRWRGAAPIHRAIMSGDRETGVCLMKMDEGLDTGPVYSVLTIPIESGDDLGSLHDKLGKGGADLLAKDIGAIERGEIPAAPQPEEGVTYATKVSAAEAALCWKEDAPALGRKIRALSPFPGAYTMLRGARLKIFEARVVQDAPSGEELAGEITFLDDRSLEVRCGSGSLSLLEVQLEGRRRMPVADFLRGVSISRGEVLGDESR